MATVLVNERITSSEHTQDTRHIELDLGGSGISYEPGDILSIMPRQSTAAVARFLARISLSADAWISMQPAQGAAVGQEPVSHQVRLCSMPTAITKGSCCKQSARIEKGKLETQWSTASGRQAQADCAAAPVRAQKPAHDACPDNVSRLARGDAHGNVAADQHTCTAAPTEIYC